MRDHKWSFDQRNSNVNGRVEEVQQENPKQRKLDRTTCMSTAQRAKSL